MPGEKVLEDTNTGEDRRGKGNTETTWRSGEKLASNKQAHARVASNRRMRAESEAKGAKGWECRTPVFGVGGAERSDGGGGRVFGDAGGGVAGQEAQGRQVLQH